MLRGAGLAVLCFAGQLTAQDVAVPETCNPVVTSHNNACGTATMMRCEDSTWRGVSYRKGRLVGTIHYSAEWDFLKWETEGAARMTFEKIPESGMAMDARALREVGTHQSSAQFVINTNVLKDQTYTLSGSTEAKGEVVTLGDETFEVYVGERNFQRDGRDGTLNFRFEILLSQTRDLAIEGRSARAVNNRNWQEFDTQPKALRGPGEPGFLATTSEFGCG